MKTSILILIALGCFSIALGFEMINTKANNEILAKQNNCIINMQKAIPDANDTEARSAFLQSCEQ